MSSIKDVIIDTLVDTVKLIPFLFLTYLLMEFVEHKTSGKALDGIRKAGKAGPAIGALLGIVPQCGFSASASGLYSGGLISIGTLLAIFLSTSDEMLPICISEQVKPSVVIEILAVKVVVALIMGFGADILMKILRKDKKDVEIRSICQNEHCHCDEEGIFKSALHHSAQIVAFIFIITFVLNTLIHYIGEEAIGKLFVDVPVLGCAIAALIGLIPNCAASVVITELFLSGIINTGAMIAGLLTGCGIGILVLFRTNRKLKENILIVLTLYLMGFAAGAVTELLGIVIA